MSVLSALGTSKQQSGNERTHTTPNGSAGTRLPLRMVEKPKRVHKAMPRPSGKERRTEPASNEAGSRLKKLESLLELESSVRRRQTLRELIYCLANEPLELTGCRQIFIFRFNAWGRRNTRLDTVSSLSSIDSNSPKVIALEQAFDPILKSLMERNNDERSKALAFNILLDANDAPLNGILVPLIDDKFRPFAAMVFLSGDDGYAEPQPVHERIGEIARHTWLKLQPRRRSNVSKWMARGIGLGLMVVTAVAMFIPVPLSALAPVEIVARNPQVISAPIDGIIEEILVDPNSEISRGTPLFRFVDTTLASNHDIASQKMLVAEARLNTARQNSFGIGEGKRDLATAEAELKLAGAELAHAAAQLAKAVVISQTAGIAVLDRKSVWQGRPVSVGERVLQIANPASIEAEIRLPVGDAIVLDTGARVKLFLDSSPLSPVEGMVQSASYRAVIQDGDDVSYQVMAELSGTQNIALRIGGRGTAQVFGETVSLGFYLFRRPLSYLRQWTGW